MPTIRERFLRKPIPTYRKHRASGQAVVTLSGKDVYLGPYGSKASRKEYDRLIGQWLAAGRCLPTPEHGDLTVAELATAYVRFAREYYRKDGRPTGELSPLLLAVRFVRLQYAHTPAAEFGPLALEAVRNRMVEESLARTTINRHVDRIRRMFRWATAKQLVAPGVLEGLKAVAGLRRGRTTAREPEPVQPVADEVIDATLPHLPRVVADMIVFQRLTGCRPGEVCQLRPADVDRSADVWAFRPRSHKTQHHGRQRVIFVGPKAQAVLLPYLLRDADSLCFRPTESEAKRYADLRAHRKTPVQPSQVNRRKRRPRVTPGEVYTHRSLGYAVRRAVARANKIRTKEAAKQGVAPVLLAHWHPNQLRHTAATEIRKQFGGLEAVAAVLGHSHMNVSEIYAEKNMDLAAEIMRKIG